jgi:hypothetical protein
MTKECSSIRLNQTDFRYTGESCHATNVQYFIRHDSVFRNGVPVHSLADKPAFLQPPRLCRIIGNNSSLDPDDTRPVKATGTGARTDSLTIHFLQNGSPSQYPISAGA